MSKSRIMFEMTVEDVREGLKEIRTVIVPVGVVEQHGYHLPLSVDICSAVEIAARASEISGCFVAPPLNYCFSGGTLPGTINLSPHTFSLALIDICHSLAVQGFKNIVILLGHGGTENTRAAKDAAENFLRLRPHLEGVTVSVVPFWELSPSYMKSFDEKDFHAGRYETSMMLYLKPDLVKMDRAKLDRPEIAAMMRDDPDAYVKKEKKVENPFLIPKLTQHPDIEVGVMGDFTGANAELGRTIVREASQGLADYVKQLEKANPA